jgi:hypothetical protein
MCAEDKNIYERLLGELLPNTDFLVTVSIQLSDHIIHAKGDGNDHVHREGLEIDLMKRLAFKV